MQEFESTMSSLTEWLLYVISALIAIITLVASISDDEFVKYLETKGNVFTLMVKNLRYTLVFSIFAALFCQSYRITFDLIGADHLILLSSMAHAFVVYSTVAALWVVFEILYYAKQRAMFLMK